MCLLPQLDVTGNHPVWSAAILPVTLITFMKIIWDRMEGVLVGGFGDGTFLVDLAFFGLDGDIPCPWPGNWGGDCGPSRRLGQAGWQRTRNRWLVSKC